TEAAAQEARVATGVQTFYRAQLRTRLPDELNEFAGLFGDLREGEQLAFYRFSESEAWRVGRLPYPVDEEADITWARVVTYERAGGRLYIGFPTGATDPGTGRILYILRNIPTESVETGQSVE